MCDHSVAPLTQLEVLVVDCQATAAGPSGHLLEIGWARLGAAKPRPESRLIKLPDGERVPRAVVRVTGISDGMARTGVEPGIAWSELSGEASRLAQQPAPTVAHFARFEQPFLQSLAGGIPPLDLVCTHEIARRLLPGLPRRSLRAVTGYFGHAVGPLRRSAEHVEATAFVWRELVALLDAEGISTWRALRQWLAEPLACQRNVRRVWPMPRDLRLTLPDAPGLYRMLRTNGDILYVGKATSLRHRVNSYFRKQHGVHERTLEMLSQARALSFEVTPSTLEAALLEPDEIKRHRPPYNVALTGGGREVWFASADFGERSAHASSRCPVGPFASSDVIDQFAALARGSPLALGHGRWAPAPAVFEAGYSRLRKAHAELSREDLSAHLRLMHLGTRLWREGRRDRDGEQEATTGPDRQRPVWTPEVVQTSLEWLALRGALSLRRARWLTWLAEAAVVWSEPGVDGARLIVIEHGDIVTRARVEAGTTPPIPPGLLRPAAGRHAAFTVARLDRLRVLTTELKRLAAEGAPVALRFGQPVLAGARLARALAWV